MSQVVLYRNKDGVILDRSIKPRFERNENGRVNFCESLAELVLCPETGCLKYIGKCEACKKFIEHVKHEGVRCASETKIEIPIYYNKTKYYGYQKQRKKSASKNNRADRRTNQKCD